MDYKFKVMTFNMGYAGISTCSADNRRDIVSGIIRRTSPDIICAQEMSAPARVRWKLDIDTRYEYKNNAQYAGVMWDKGRFSFAKTYSAKDKDELRHVDWDPEMTTRCCIVKLKDRSTAKDVVLISWNEHNLGSTEAAQKHLSNLQRFARSLSVRDHVPVIIGGGYMMRWVDFDIHHDFEVKTPHQDKLNFFLVSQGVKTCRVRDIQTYVAKGILENRPTIMTVSLDDQADIGSDESETLSDISSVSSPCRILPEIRSSARQTQKPKMGVNVHVQADRFTRKMAHPSSAKATRHPTVTSPPQVTSPPPVTSNKHPLADADTSPPLPSDPPPGVATPSANSDFFSFPSTTVPQDLLSQLDPTARAMVTLMEQHNHNILQVLTTHLNKTEERFNQMVALLIKKNNDRSSKETGLETQQQKIEHMDTRLTKVELACKELNEDIEEIEKGVAVAVYSVNSQS